MSEYVERRLEWRISWDEITPGRSGTYRERIFTDIEELKAYRRMLFARLDLGDVRGIRTEQRCRQIKETAWVTPRWVR